jgi:superfamily II DNA or RNA helicase
MFSITPEYLSDFVTFRDNDASWRYQKDDTDMAKIQAEGSAKLWNLLLDKKIALLADEVGMGKTIQGLAVMVTLWRQKPDAKVLLYAPNENVARKWIREYENFIRYHYRQEDNLIKSSILRTPMRKAVYCENHLELMRRLHEKWPSFYVCKTSSLSGFLSVKLTDEALSGIGIPMRRPKEVFDTGKNTPEDDRKLEEWVSNFGKACNAKAYELLGDIHSGRPPFDLVLFDEAHYLRHSDGRSYRSLAANAFFSCLCPNSNEVDGYRPIAARALLLTATPNHSRPVDICNMAGLFHPEYREKEPLGILREICVRRFRRLVGKTKHEYRLEIPEGVEMQHLRERLFFAAYHKKYVKLRAEQEKKSGMDQYRVLFGYLEGFEFLPRKKDQSLEKQHDSTDFRERDDTDVIVALAKKYEAVYSTPPEHPKYRRIIEELRPVKENNFNPEKKVVFVRRIGSVFEISGRLVKDYNQVYLDFLGKIVPKDVANNLGQKARTHFWKLAQHEDIPPEESDEKNNVGKKREVNPEMLVGITSLENTILDLFTVKKDASKHRSTDCSNFRNRFLRREQIFSVFFEPGSDYKARPYRLSNILVKQQDKQKERRYYKPSAQKYRLEYSVTEEDVRLNLEQQFEIQADTYTSIPMEEIEIETLMTIWLTFETRLSESEKIILPAREQYLRFSTYEKEGFSNYLEKGLLFASQYVVQFYRIYRDILEVHQKSRGEDLYLAFCETVKRMIGSSGLAALIASAVMTFERFYKKELGLTGERLIKENWSFLNNMLPVYPYCSDTKRESIIKAFNTPFYPNVLVATSVLQEGVDLHYHCSEIIHYGIAWTQGDNEQRIGRVDRLFGKLENRLLTDTGATLPIHYPYLKNTIDQDQVARFVMRKHQSEKLIDQLKDVHFSNEINFSEQVPDTVWTDCFNAPGNKESVQDPFPINYEVDFTGISTAQETSKSQTVIAGLLHPLYNTLKHHFKDEFVLLDKKWDGKSGSGDEEKFFAIKHIRKNQRHQPVIGAMYNSEPGLYFTKNPVYCLRLLTPLSRNARHMKEIYNNLGPLKRTYLDNPLLKICLNNTQKGLFRYYICIDLPVFAIRGTQFNLSHNEVIQAIESLIDFSDRFEQVLHGEKFDIKNEEVVSRENTKWHSADVQRLSEDRNEHSGNGWHASNSDRYHYQEIGTADRTEDEIHQYNHEVLFLRKLHKNRKTVLQVGLYKNDALEQEYYLLDKILKSS